MTVCAPAAAQEEFMIPMRDGPRLHTKIFVPKNQSGPLPIILKRTPYGIEGSAGNGGACADDQTDAAGDRFDETVSGPRLHGAFPGLLPCA